jgi:hypothetical protein
VGRQAGGAGRDRAGSTRLVAHRLRTSPSKKARGFTYTPGDVIDEPLALSMIEEAVRVAMIPRSALG